MTATVSLRATLIVAIVAAGTLAACGARTGTATGIPVDASVGTDAPTTDAKADVAEPPVCAASREQEQCFTKAELEFIWNHTPLGGDNAVDAGPPPFDPNGCLPRAAVYDDCCNVPTRGPQFRGNVCCYTFCTGSCC